MNSPLNRRFPKVLAAELKAALAVTHELGHERALELLDIYRRNYIKRIATWGILNMGAPVHGLEPFPPERLQQFERLDIAFQKLHEYLNGGAGDYVAADVVKTINSFNAQRPRKRASYQDEIGAWLARKDYVDSDDKDALVKLAMAQFDVSERTVRRALSKRGLTRKNKPLSPNG